MRGLVQHRTILRVALAACSIFAWIFAFQFFYIISPDLRVALARVALLYATSQAITCLLTPYAAIKLRLGARRALSIATFIAALAYAALAMAFQSWWGIGGIAGGVTAFAVLLGLYRALYFVPYSTSAENARPKRLFGAEVFIALVPALAGLTIAAYTRAPIWLLYASSIAILISIIPLSKMRDVHEVFSWSYRQTFARLFERADRALVLRAFLDGVAGSALLFFWPIAVYILLGWSYGLLGIVLTLTYIVTLFTRNLIRDLVKRVSSRNAMALNAALAVSPWIFRLVVASPLGIISTDAFFYTTAPRQWGMDPFIFEQTADGNTFVDEYTALKEMALALGRMATAFLGAYVALSASLPLALVAVFLAAALASLAGVFVATR